MYLWYEKGDISKIKAIMPEKTIVFDTETTGIDAGGKDEIIQLSIVNGLGDVLFSSYIKPEHRRSWPKATEVNGISPAMVKNSPKFEDVYDEIQTIFDEAELVVGYNVEFDLKFIEAADVQLRPKTLVFDVMQEFAPVRGVWDDRHCDWKWCKLTACARNYGIKFQAHDALEDTEATRQCFYKLLEDLDYISIFEKRKENERKAQERIKAQKEAEKQAIVAAAEKKKKRKRALMIIATIFCVAGIFMVDDMEGRLFYLVLSCLCGYYWYRKKKIATKKE